MSRPIRRCIAPRAAIATILFAFLTLISGVRAGMAETFAYVGNADSNDISVFKMAESGEMTAGADRRLHGRREARLLDAARDHPRPPRADRRRPLAALLRR